MSDKQDILIPFTERIFTTMTLSECTNLADNPPRTPEMCGSSVEVAPWHWSIAPFTWCDRPAEDSFFFMARYTKNLQLRGV